MKPEQKKDLGQETIILDDPNEAAGVATLTGAEPEIETDDDGWCRFSFPNNESTSLARTQYQSGGGGNLLGFANHLRRLRRKIQLARGGRR